MRPGILKNSGRIFASGVLFASLLGGTAQGSARSSAGQEKEVDKTVVTKASGSGLLAWLESFLPQGIHFKGPAIGPRNQPEVLATANCFQSVSGRSCDGFRNLEEYLAAVHVSSNLGIPFNRLKAKMQSGRTLSQAIKELRPRANGRVEAQRAEQQALRTLRDMSS